MSEDRYEEIHSLFQLEATNLYNYVSHMCPPWMDAQDVVQDVFIKAFRYWHKFNHKSSARTWLFKIARNHIKDMYRKEKRESESLYRLQSSSRQSTSLSSSLELQEIIELLPLMQRETIFLRIIQGFSTKETAEILKVSPMNVRVSLYRARKLIVKLWFSDSADEGGKLHGENLH
ncbi:RNA polymerase sigma factor [Alicyclobacillus sp. SO9]|uniref:RNA polymerase sigma factor n=1 Tax=Alicyclobacillus sp. SO9 TaxID=2665646 RepID=UPI0018E85469|nr:sigma-70 family RNA polymerase sigma factor [Alicyclobacillus sp. SO9]QQE77126.1 sigma-70 family RNA polymerase sigma factor [Alicyclobacillus sp. SO9]